VTPLAFVVVTLAIARVTRLITTDDLTAGLRDALVEQAYGESVEEPTAKPPWYLVLVNCDWCVSVWVALVGALLAKISDFATTWVWAAWCWPSMAFASATTLKLSGGT
jgi:hypothetical protein